MKRLVLAAALSLPACSTAALTPSLSPAGQLAAKKSETSAEIAYGVAEQAYVAGEPYFDTHSAQKVAAKNLIAQGLIALHAARDAEMIGDTATINAKITAIEDIKAQIVALTKGR